MFGLENFLKLKNIFKTIKQTLTVEVDFPLCFL